MAIIQIIHLTQKTYRVPPIAYMVQGDTGRELRMVIDDIELTGNPTAELSFMRADQSFYSVNAEFESQTNSFVADVTQAITQAGTTKAQLKVTSSSKVVSSYTFLIFVEPNTDGLPTEQMGWPLEDIMNAVNELMYGALGLSDDVKEALLDCFAHVAWINDQGQTYYDALEDALYPPVPVSSVTVTPSTFQLSSIGATQQLTATIAPSSAQATVTWSSSDTSVATVSESGLVTSVAVGTATITASAGGVDGTAACTIALPTLSSISAVYTQSGTVYDSDSLDSLKDDLVVTATWSDSTTTTVPSTDYTLSGTLTIGTSTVTVSYGGKTTTFTVTVTKTPEVGLVYENPTTLVFDGTQASMVDTEYAPENDPFTIAIEWDSWAWPDNNNNTTVLLSLYSSTPSNNQVVSVSNGGWGSHSEVSLISFGFATGTSNFTGNKLVVTRASSAKPTWYYKNTSGELVTVTTSNNPSLPASNVWIGGRVRSTDGLTAECFATAEITTFKVYSILWREEKIKEFLGVES